MAEPSPSWVSRTYGEARLPPVVLLHSIATSGEMWMPQIGAWSRHFHCVAVDLPGHGESAPDPEINSIEDYADRLMGQLTAPTVSIVGLSLGGMIAQSCALRHPGRIRSVVIADSLAVTPAPAAELWEARSSRAQRDGMVSQTEETLARWFTATFRNEHPLTIDWIASLIERTSVMGYRAAVKAIQGLNNFDRLHQIRCPALVLTGAEDPVVKPALAFSLAAQIRGATVSTLPAAAHLSNVDQPLLFTETVGSFLKRTHAQGSR